MSEETKAFQVIIGEISKVDISSGSIAGWLLDASISVWRDEEGYFRERQGNPYPHIWDRPVELAIRQGDLYFMEGMFYESREEFRKAVIFLWEKYYINEVDEDEDVELMEKLKLIIRSLTIYGIDGEGEFDF